MGVTAITNGTQLYQFKDLLGPEDISFLQITVDGAEAEHNSRRHGPNGSPTFNHIMQGIDLALSRESRVKMRINVDAFNVASLPDLADAIHHRGWHKCENFSAYAIPVHESAGKGRRSNFTHWPTSQWRNHFGSCQSESLERTFHCIQ